MLLNDFRINIYIIDNVSYLISKKDENISSNNNNNYLINNKKEISEYNLLKYSNNNRNESKGRNRFNTVKKYNCGKLKPKIINNDKYKFLKNLQLKIINGNCRICSKDF